MGSFCRNSSINLNTRHEHHSSRLILFYNIYYESTVFGYPEIHALQNTNRLSVFQSVSEIKAAHRPLNKYIQKETKDVCFKMQFIERVTYMLTVVKSNLDAHRLRFVSW